MSKQELKYSLKVLDTFAFWHYLLIEHDGKGPTFARHHQLLETHCGNDMKGNTQLIRINVTIELRSIHLWRPWPLLLMAKVRPFA